MVPKIFHLCLAIGDSFVIIVELQRVEDVYRLNCDLEGLLGGLAGTKQTNAASGKTIDPSSYLIADFF